jgi:hypothetical protein
MVSVGAADDARGNQARHLAVPAFMNRLAVLVVLAGAAAIACESLGGPQRLAADLQAQGLPAFVGREFNDVLLGGAGSVVCVGDESVDVLEFPDQDAAIDAAATINQNDPSNVGNGIVEWVGPPRFWLRDRSIIVYVGGDPAVDAALRHALGQPFAESLDPGRGLPDGAAKPPCR